MKTRISILILLVFLMANSSIKAQQPYFRLQNLQNEWIDFKDVKGEKLTVIDFWATWCQPCVRSIPELNKIAQEFGNRGVAMVGISIDGPRNQSKILPFVNSLGINYPILRDINSEVMTDMNVTSVPTLLIFNSRGDLVYTHEGYRPGDENVIRGEIEKHL